MFVRLSIRNQNSHHQETTLARRGKVQGIRCRDFRKRRCDEGQYSAWYQGRTVGCKQHSSGTHSWLYTVDTFYRAWLQPTGAWIQSTNMWI